MLRSPPWGGASAQCGWISLITLAGTSSDCLAGLLAWCATLGLWPQGMKETLDRAALEIKTTDIEAADAKAREEAEKREAKGRSVEFNGRDVDPKTAD